MYPTLYHFIKDLTGIEFCLAQIVQTFGFFVALCFFFGAYFFSLELKRKEKLGWLKPQKASLPKKEDKQEGWQQHIISLIIGFAVGYKLLDLLLDSCTLAADIRSYLFSTKGSILGGVLGVVASAALIYWENKKAKETPQSNSTDTLIHPHEHVGNMTFIGGLFGIIGAKIFALLENPDEIAGVFQSIDSFFS